MPQVDNTASSKNDEQPPATAALFDSLAHPTRIKIIEILGEKDQSFSEIKRRLGVESSGHLQFHLNKLEPLLVRLSSDGKNYTLTSEGRESLRLVGQVMVTKSKLVLKPQRDNDRFLRWISDRHARAVIWQVIGIAMFLVPIFIITQSVNYWETYNPVTSFSEYGFGGSALWDFILPMTFELMIIVLGIFLIARAGNDSRSIKVVISGLLIAGIGFALAAFWPLVFPYATALSAGGVTCQTTVAISICTGAQVSQINYHEGFSGSFNYTFLLLAALCLFASAYLLRKLLSSKISIPSASRA